MTVPLSIFRDETSEGPLIKTTSFISAFMSEICTLRDHDSHGNFTDIDTFVTVRRSLPGPWEHSYLTTLGTRRKPLELLLRDTGIALLYRRQKRQHAIYLTVAYTMKGGTSRVLYRLR